MEYTYRRITRNIDVHDSELLRHCPVDILRDAIDLHGLRISTWEHEFLGFTVSHLPPKRCRVPVSCSRGQVGPVPQACSHQYSLCISLGMRTDSRVMNDD
jgi:hypothetical protein